MVRTDQPSRGPAPVVAAARRVTAARVALLLGILGVGYRLAMLLLGLPTTNSDEATSGLVALHLSQGREFPLFFYGQYYMGALESYLAAPLFVLAGAGLVPLRLPNLLFYVAFLALMWQLTRRLYTAWFATGTVGLLALGSDRILKNQLIAGGGYPEMVPAGALLVLLAVQLALGRLRRPALGYAGWGLVAGLTLWDDWLVLPYVAAAGTLLLVARWRELRGRTGMALAGGLVTGLVPIVAHNLLAAPEHRSLVIYQQLGGGDPVSWVDRIHGGVLFGLPMGTGFCAPGRCAPGQLWWGVVAPLLLVVAGLLAARALWRALPSGSGGHRERIRQGGRLVLVIAAALSLLAYAISAAAGSTPVESSRYLSCLLISLPVLLWPLWSAATGGRWQPGVRNGTDAIVRNRPIVRNAARVVLAAVAVSMLAATAAVLAEAPAMSRAAEQRRELVATLDRLSVSHFYTEYWTCNTIIFATRERLVCAVIRDDLHAGWDRYPPYRTSVEGADRPAYVLPAGSPLSAAVAAELARTGVPVTRTGAAGYDIYQLAAPVELPLR